MWVTVRVCGEYTLPPLAPQLHENHIFERPSLPLGLVLELELEFVFYLTYPFLWGVGDFVEFVLTTTSLNALAFVARDPQSSSNPP
jgi:hypothetical protein